MKMTEQERAERARVKAREKYRAEHHKNLIPFAGKDAEPIVAMALARTKREAAQPQPPALIDQLETILSGIPPRRRCIVVQLLLARVQTAANIMQQLGV